MTASVITCPTNSRLATAGGPGEDEFLSKWKTRVQAELAAENQAEQKRVELLQMQVVTFKELRELSKENHETLEGIRRLLGTSASVKLVPGTELTDASKLRELDRLLAMAKALDEIAVSALRSARNSCESGSSLKRLSNAA